MVRQAATQASKEVVPAAQGRFQIGQRANVNFGHRAQFIEVGIVDGHVIHGHRLIGPEGGQHADFKIRRSQGLVVFERVGGVVGGAKGFHLHHAQQVAHRVRGGLQPGAARVPKGFIINAGEET